ncbi:MAG TPA: polymer-forming cytoskeletal protein [Ramlibacter sp.]|nr:polymer-forming cytoskeletal protein [Ramlibacter sp.]
MFGKKAQPPIKSLIASGTRIDGNMKFDEGLRVDGEVFGDIQAGSEAGTSMLVISEAAVVQGAIQADHVIINGTVRGPVQCRELLELQPKARIEGDVSYVALEMHQGATISGQLRPLAAGVTTSSTATATAEDEKPTLKLATKSA